MRMYHDSRSVVHAKLASQSSSSRLSSKLSGVVFYFIIVSLITCI